MPEGKSDDLMEVARKLCDDLIQAWLLHHSREEAAEIAVQALLAERERCAKIADDMYGEGRSRSYDDGCTEAGWNDATQAISKAILHRGEPSA